MVTLKKVLASSFLWIMLLLMYLPILVLIAFSFTDTNVIGVWNNGGGWLETGLSGDLYVNLFHNQEIGIALGNTVILAITSALVSTAIGTIGAIGSFYSKRRTQTVIEGMTQIPVVNAEVVMALSLTVMFVFAGNIIFRNSLFSYWTLLAGHCVLSMPFVYLNVKPKLQQMNPELYEAALDLNATPAQALRKVIIPQIAPGISSGFLLAISLSLDDYIVTAFTAGNGLLSGDNTITTLSTLIQSKIRKGPVPPEMRPLTTFIFLAVVLVVIINTIYTNHHSKNIQAIHARKRAKLAKERR